MFIRPFLTGETFRPDRYIYKTDVLIATPFEGFILEYH